MQVIDRNDNNLIREAEYSKKTVAAATKEIKQAERRQERLSLRR